MNFKYKQGSVAFVLNENFEIIVINRGDTVSIPGGKREPDESSLQCCVRETFEETGVVLDPQKAIDIHSGICGANGEGQKAIPYWVSSYLFFVNKRDIVFNPVEKDKTPSWMPLEQFKESNAFFQYNFEVVSRIESLVG